MERIVMKKREYDHKRSRSGKGRHHDNGNHFFYDSHSFLLQQSDNNNTSRQDSFNYDDMDLSEAREFRRRLKRMRYDDNNRRSGEY